MSQNPPFYYPGGQPPHTSPSQAPPPPHPQQSSPMNIAPAMQAQQTAFQQNAALSTNPMEMLARMNISLTPEQLMQLAQMFQSGAIPLAPPTAAPRSNQPPQPQPTHQPQAVLSGTNDDDADMDKEEGEVEEEEIADAAPARGFLKTPPKGPRRRSRSPQPRFGEDKRRPSQPRVRSPVHPAANGRRSSAFGRVDIRAPPAPQQNGKHSTVRLDKGAEVKIFIKEMFNAGHSYDSIAKYINHPQQFQRLWDSLGLPRGPAATTSVNQKTAMQEVPKAPAKRAPPPKPAAAPQDRSAYLAKLQAAKNKKTEAQAASPTAIQPQAAPATVQQPSNNSTPQPARRAIDSNLVRQRLEALKAAKAKAEAEKKAAEVAANKVATSTSASDSDMDMSKSEASEPLVNEPHVVDERDAAASGNLVAAGQPEQAQMPQPAAPSTHRGPGLPGLFTSGAAIMPSPTLSQPHHGTGSPSFPGPYPNYSKAHTGQRNVGHSSRTSFGMGVPSHERVIIIDSDEESDAGEAEYVPTGPFNAFPVRKSKDGESAGPATPVAPNPEAEQKLAAMKKELADMMRNQEEKKRKKKAAANATANGSGSEAGTPAGIQTPIQPHQATASPLATRAVEVDNMNDPDEKVLGNGEDVVLEAVPLEPRPASTVCASFQGELEQQARNPISFADSEQPYHNNKASQAPVVTEVAELQNGGDVQETENSQVEPSVATFGYDAEPLPATALPLPDDEEGDVDIDDDDLDDIYEQSGPPAQRAQPITTMTHADYDTEDEDDTGSAMDTSSDDSDDSDDYYEPADGTTGVEAMPSAAPEPMPEPVPVPLPTPKPKPNESEQSGEDSTESEADAGDIAASEDDEVDDELAAELQPSEEEPAAPEIQPARTAKYTPYVSPLSRFKDYRYHCDFLATVPGGFKSLTYNHKIDPITVVCPFETSGGKCNDKTCEFQHFDSMALSDNQLLKLMGADQIPAKDPEDVKKWKTGLASLISQIRVQNQAKDVEAISKRIAEYRREFVGDPSKVLLLD